MDTSAFQLREPEPGDLGWIVHMHGVLYGREFGWGAPFEGLVAEIVGAFAKDFDPQHDHCWLAELEGRKVGSVLVVKNAPGIAQLRLLLVDPSARGRGVGAGLVRACTDFARGAGYEKLVLWTNTELHSARRIYEAEGYLKVREENHEGFGFDFIGEYWEMTL